MHRVRLIHLLRLALIALVAFASLALLTSGIGAPAPTESAFSLEAARARPQSRSLLRVARSEAALDRAATIASDGVASDLLTDDLRLDMVLDTEITVEEKVPFAIQQVADASLYRGRVAVAQAGSPGLTRKVYAVRTVGGAVTDRRILASIEVTAPVAEIRRVGTKPPPAPVAVGAIQQIIVDAAARWGADPTQLLRVARCESGYNPNAYNARSGASGLFQFLASTWAANSVRAGYGGVSVFDAVANANTAAYMFARGQARQWSCK